MDNSALVEALRDGSLIAFLGAGVSRPYVDPQSGLGFPGLPTTADLLERLRGSRAGNFDPQATFSQTCFLLKHAEGRQALEKFLLNELEKPALKPLPAHTLCSNLPFAAYITTNFDILLERALGDARRPYHVIVSDDDVSRLSPGKTPVVKLHGCLTKPSSIIVAEDEYEGVGVRRPIVEAQLKATLANKSVVFLGFALQDKDFEFLFEEVHKMLGARMPRSTAVVRAPTQFQVRYWEAKGVKVIDEDLTTFLKELVKASTDLGAVSLQRRAFHRRDDWINNTYFSSLVAFRSLPSETQVIDAFLSHLLTELRSPHRTLTEIIASARQARMLVLEARPNYVALEKLSKTLIDKIEADCGSDKDKAELIINTLINERAQVAVAIGAKAPTVIKKNSNILVFSQSVRIFDVLKGAPRGVQDTCHIYVAECRPKSPESFQDALAIAEELKGTGYQITLIPDAAIGNLIARKQIDRVLLGAHAIYLRSGKPLNFVNTCGSRMVLSAAKAHNVPVFVIGESFKWINLPDDVTEPAVSYDQEEALFGGLLGRLTELKASGCRISAINVGYDLCGIDDNVTLVSET
jgi:translation initiation factor 2B subunit (eIF-2B alpha/beta/delta family)/NAD-dependent SIR2 family protein deacetylase